MNPVPMPRSREMAKSLPVQFIRKSYHQIEHLLIISSSMEQSSSSARYVEKPPWKAHQNKLYAFWSANSMVYNKDELRVNLGTELPLDISISTTTASEQLDDLSDLVKSSDRLTNRTFNSSDIPRSSEHQWYQKGQAGSDYLDFEGQWSGYPPTGWWSLFV